MVQIVPDSNPAVPQVAVGAANVDSEAITEDAIDVSTDVDPAAMPSGFAASGSEQPNSITSAVPPDWQSQRTQRSRQIGLIVALSLSSLIGAILLFGWFVRSWQQDIVNETPAEPNRVIAAATDSSPATSTPTRDQPLVTQSQQEHETDVPKESDVSNSEPVESQTSTDQSLEDVDAEKPASDMTPSQIATQDVSSIPSDLLPQSPLDPLTPQVDEAESDQDASSMERLPDGLQKFVPILNLGGDQRETTLEAPPTLDDIKVEAAAEEELDPMLVATPPKPINMRRALAIEFALSPSGGSYPLSDLVLTVSQITGVPIQIDWVTFELVGIGIGDRVPVKKGWNSAEALLDSLAESIGGVVQRDQQMLTLMPSDATIQERLGDLFDLTDFGDGRDSVTEVLNQFLPSGEIATVLQQPRDQQNLAALAVEAMRRIRGVAPKVPEPRFRHWAQPVSDALLEWPILAAGDAGPQYDAPLTMAGFLRRTARRNQATCFVNWFDANRRRMSPAQLTMPFTGVSAGEMVAKELKPFSLQLRQVDANHWWVGSEATYDRFPVIVWTDPLGADQAVLTQRLANAVASTDGGLFRMAIDSQTGRALLLLPRFLVRQLPTIQNGLNLTRAR